MKICLKKIFIIFIVFLVGLTSFFNVSKSLSADEFVETNVEVMVSCGDGFAIAINGEVCDPGAPEYGIPPDIGTSTCQDYLDVFGDPFESGDLGCLDDCTDYASSTCYTCGNGHKEDEESCDGSSFGGETCTTFGFDSGTLFCTDQCQLTTINCEARIDQGGIPGGGTTGGSSGGPAGFSPGANEEYKTNVVMRGKAYPHADVHILVDGKVLGIVKADNKADFYFETEEISPGVVSFGFWSEDPDGLKSTLLSLTFRVISGAVTTISGVYLSPSIDIDKKSVTQGEEITVYGHSVPNTQIDVYIHSEGEHISSTTTENETGSWKLVFNTEPLEEDFHIAKALFQVQADKNIIKSGFSRSVSFYVGKLGGEPTCAEADLNHDSRVNLTDFSILLFYWGTDNPCADQNQNGTVDLIDFSIMMYYWTG